jgi:hypothetical protein
MYEIFVPPFLIAFSCYVLVMSNSTHTRDRLVGTVVDWNTKGYYDVYYPEPSCEANCSVTESFTKTPDYASKCLGISYV